MDIPVSGTVRRILFALGLVGLLLSQPAGAEEDFPSLLDKARGGDANAQVEVGLRYYNGTGVEADPSEAAAWFGEAVRRGSIRGKVFLGMLLLYGEGVAQDPDRAARLFREADASGNDWAAYLLGMLHSNGVGVDEDEEEAMRYFRRAADAGNEAARNIVTAKAGLTDGSARDTAETIFFLSDDLKSAVSYFNNRGRDKGDFRFLFERGFPKERIMYARPKNYGWVDGYVSNGKTHDALGFPQTTNYAYLRRHPDTSTFLRETGRLRYLLRIDGSECLGEGCIMDENIIAAVLPKKFKVLGYRGNAIGTWKVVGNTYTFYSKNVKGASIDIELEDTVPYVYAELAKVLARFSDIKVSYDGTNVKVTMPVEGMFESGEAVIRGGGEKWLAAFLEPLKRAEIKELRVEGHSDNVPIRKGRKSAYPSNWELSAARAATVVRYFVELGMDSAKLAAVGYADSRPVSGNDTPEGRAKNRRIEFTIVPQVETAL